MLRVAIAPINQPIAENVIIFSTSSLVESSCLEARAIQTPPIAQIKPPNAQVMNISTKTIAYC